jgi:integrase
MPRKPGIIEKRGDKKFLVRVYVGKSENGKNKYANKMVRGTLKDAQTVLNDMLKKKDMGELLKTPTLMTVQEFFDSWIESYPSITEVTRDDYRYYLKHYAYSFKPDKKTKQTLGEKRLTDLDFTILENLYKYMMTPKEEEGLGLTPRTVIYLHQMLNNALNYGVKKKLLVQNPCQYVDLPKRQKPEIQAMSEAEVSAFLDAARLNPHFVLFSVLLGTGLRPSEALALHWKDFDPMNATLAVRRTLQVHKGDVSYKQPKTARGRRNIKLPENLVKQLLEHQERQPFKSELIFPSLNDTPLDLDNLTKRDFKPLLEQAKLGVYVTVTDEDGTPVHDKGGKDKQKFVSKYTLYSLRHTHATLLLKAGVHPKIVSERLGHSSIALTLDVYSHVLPGMQDEAASKLDSMLYPTKPEAPRVLT